MAGNRPRRRPSTESPPVDLESALAGLPDNFIRCRDLMHAWGPYDAEEIGTKLIEQIVRCPSCKNKKSRIVNRVTGGIVRGWRPYGKYVEGYLLTGVGRITAEDRNLVRRESNLRDVFKPAPVRKVS